MERVEIKDQSSFILALSSGICCVAQEGARQVVNDAGIAENEFGEKVFVVQTLAGNLSFVNHITLFIFISAREAQKFLNFERCEFSEDWILNSEIIEEEE